MMSLIAVALMSVVNAGEPAKCTGTTCSAARKVEVSRVRTRTRTKFEQEKNGKVLVPDAWFPWKPSSTNQKFGRKKRCR